VDGFILTHPFIYYFVFTEFIYEFEGSDVSFFTFWDILLSVSH
jgi:hypothetical protein